MGITEEGRFGSDESKTMPDRQNKVMGLFLFESLRTEEVVNFLVTITREPTVLIFNNVF